MVHSGEKRLGVCLNVYSDNRALLDAAEDIAGREGCRWYAITIELTDHVLDPILRQRLELSLDKAREAGAEIIRLPSSDIAQGIITAADLHGLTHVIVGRRRKSRLATLFNPTLATRLLKHDPPFELQVVVLDSVDENSVGLPVFQKWRSYAASIGLISVVTLVVEIIQESLPEYRFNASIYNVSMVYLLAIVFLALRYGFWPAMVAALLSFGFYNFFFIPPFYAFGLGQASDVLNFALFLSASLISATVADVYKRNMVLLKERERAARALHDLSKDVAGSGDKKEVTLSLAQHLGEILQSDVVLFLRNGSLQAVFPAGVSLSQDAVAASFAAFEKQYSTHADGWAFYPITTPRRKIGVVAVADSGHHHSQKLIEALCYQAALALERTHLMHESEEMKLKHQRESLRSALLSSVSHDLKTPLVSIIGSLSSLRHMDDSLSKEEQHALLHTAIHEAERLNQSITNILDMTRIESGALKPRKEWVDTDSLFADAVQRQSDRLAAHKVVLEKAAAPFAVYIDPVLFPQIMHNLLENAAKYTPEGSHVSLSAGVEKGKAVLRVVDNGPGIPAAERDRVFDKFTRLEKRDARIAGTGLGLAICKAIVDVHDGSIMLEDAPGGAGVAVVITLNEYHDIVDEQADEHD